MDDQLTGTFSQITRRASRNVRNTNALSFCPPDNHRVLLEIARTIVEILSTALELRFGFLGLAQTKPRVLRRLNAVFPSCG
jgi:hypothetical protein